MRLLPSIFFFVVVVFNFFFLRERQRERTEEVQRERDRERVPSRLHTVSTESNTGLELTNHEIMT